MSAPSRNAFYGGQHNYWDIPGLILSQPNNAFIYVNAARLSPTAALPANMAIVGSGFEVPMIIDIEFCSDTAIEYMYGQHNGDPGFAQPGSGATVGPNNGTSTAKFEAAVAAPVAFGNLFGGGFAAPNTPIHVLNKVWIATNATFSFVFNTTAVAANCYISVYFTEFDTE